MWSLFRKSSSVSALSQTGHPDPGQGCECGGDTLGGGVLPSPRCAHLRVVWQTAGFTPRHGLPVS